MGWTADDLLQEAVTATLEGRRRWKSRVVDFCRHLQQVTRSLASHRAEQFDAREPVLASELAPGDSEEDPLDVQGRPLTPSPDPDASEAAREEVQRIQRLFENYPLASLILDGLREGMKGPEIQNLLEISKKEYETTLKWIRRKVRAIWPREGNDA